LIFVAPFTDFSKELAISTQCGGSRNATVGMVQIAAAFQRAFCVEVMIFLESDSAVEVEDKRR